MICVWMCYDLCRPMICRMICVWKQYSLSQRLLFISLSYAALLLNNLKIISQKGIASLAKSFQLISAKLYGLYLQCIMLLCSVVQMSSSNGVKGLVAISINVTAPFGFENLCEAWMRVSFFAASSPIAFNSFFSMFFSLFFVSSFCSLWVSPRCFYI